MQPESVRVRNPIRHLMEQRGWICRLVPADTYHVAFPDMWACHKTAGERWIEFKVRRSASLSFTDAQEQWFPKLCDNGMRLWVLASEYDLRLNVNRLHLEQLYLKLYQEPNGKYIKTALATRNFRYF